MGGSSANAQPAGRERSLADQIRRTDVQAKNDRGPSLLLLQATLGLLLRTARSERGGDIAILMID